MMSREHRDKSIYLVGMMGSGKSTVGRHLARRLDRPFVDLDHEVEQTAQKSIAEIFASEGEAAFRELEARALFSSLESPTKSVVATGGGLFAREALRQAIYRVGISVYLQVPAVELVRRLADPGQRSIRPLLPASDEELLVRVTGLLEDRRLSYEASQFHVDASRDPVAVADEIFDVLERI